MHDLLFIIVLIVVYLIAAIPTGIVLAKVMGYEDVRGKGSGNIGATNVYRVAGKLPGVLTLACLCWPAKPGCRRPRPSSVSPLSWRLSAIATRCT